VLMEISGRPIFAMPGTIPSYRDLRPGDTGKDVAQLQAGLTTLGFANSDPKGTYGASTKHAVQEFYRSKGYTPQPASGQDDDLLSQAQSAVTSAQRSLRDAKIARDQAHQAGAKDLSALNLAVSDRTADLAQAMAGQARVRASTGPMVPAGEMVFLRGFPGRVDAVSTAVGATAQQKLLTVSAGRLVVKGQLAAYQKDLVHQGQEVSVLSELSGAMARATVQSVADTPHQPDPVPAGGAQPGAPVAGSGPGASYDMIAMPSGPLDLALAGQDVRLTVTAASSNQPVLVVPLAAASAGADGKTSVTVVAVESRRRVEVTTGLVGDGYTQVMPVGNAVLQPGEQVLVGT
jgi:HlyD family secretion protein